MFEIEFSEREKNSASFTEASMVFKLMKLHYTPFLFYEAPVCVIQTEQKIERNDPFLKLLIKVFTDYSDMQKDS